MFDAAYAAIAREAVLGADVTVAGEILMKTGLRNRERSYATSSREIETK
jgi:hypothetical protein